ncbi:MAG: cardiolipin synthase [Paracoccus sp. (in: a-proteobacteria)]|jgi:cardiolipin synthase
MSWLAALNALMVLAVGVRILLRRHRTPDSRAAWLLIVVALPLAGTIMYVLLGETDVGHRRMLTRRRIDAALPPARPEPSPDIPEALAEVFVLGQSISHFPAVGANQAELLPEGTPAIDRMIAEIDTAREHVHVLFYIWLDDGNGTRFAEALIRAAARGVTCRAMVDGIGSRALTRSPLWQRMKDGGVQLAIALKPGNPLLPWRNGRVDLRDHRKIVVIDNLVTFCGSQNCCDPAFLPKARFGPWVDVVMRFTGPIVRQNQRVFCLDWIEATSDDIGAVLSQPEPPYAPGFGAQVIATGPTARALAMPETFSTVIDAAQHDLLITTPYFVPDGALLSSICRAAWRGVDTTIIFPARNDDFAVAGASRSLYEDMLIAGVKIHEFLPGLLHTKSITVDGRMTLIGSANMDRRSFDLNYENNILFIDEKLTQDMRQRQGSYLDRSRKVTLDEVQKWSIPRRLWNNTLAIAGPVL